MYISRKSGHPHLKRMIGVLSDALVHICDKRMTFWPLGFCTHTLVPHSLSNIVYAILLSGHVIEVEREAAGGGHGWELVGGRCRPVRHTRPALPTHLPAPGPAEESEEDDSEGEDEDEGDDGVQKGRGIILNRKIQNLVTQNAIIRTDHISQCHFDSSATMS